MKMVVNKNIPITISIGLAILVSLAMLVVSINYQEPRISGSVIIYKPSRYPFELDMTFNVEDPNWKSFSISPIFESCQNCSISNVSYVSNSLQSTMKIKSAGDYTLLINNENGYVAEAQFNFTSKDENTVNDVNKRNNLMCWATVKQNENRPNEERNRENKKNNLLINCDESNNANNNYKSVIYNPFLWSFCLVIMILIAICYVVINKCQCTPYNTGSSLPVPEKSP